MRILLIEDEGALRQQMAGQLKAEGWAVDEAGDGEEGLYFGLEYPVDIAVVDLGLPKLPGGEIIRRWREAGRDFPVLVLTARGRWQDKVDGLEAGADDYLVKPVHPEEFLARVRALMRRAAGWSSSTINCDPINLDTRAKSVAVRGNPVDVTAYEYKVVEYLMLHAGEVVSKTELGEHVYEEDLDPDSNVLEVLVGRLRKKLDPAKELKPIDTIRGQGYRFRLPRSA